MSHRTDHVDRFVSEVRTRLNRELAWRVLRWSLLGGGAVMLAVALAYVLRGYQVPGAWYAGVFGASLLAAGGTWWLTRWRDEDAERFIDRYFDLKDSVSSMRAFERAGRHGGFYELQSEQVRRTLAKLDPGRVEMPTRGALTGGAMAVVVLAAAMAMIGPSDAVVARQIEAVRTLEQTQQLNRDIEEYVQKLIEESDPEVAELIDPSELRRWVEQLEAQDDPREALRQYAAFEREVNRMAARMSQRRDEDLLARAAEELKKDRDTRELGERLERKEYREAAEQFEDLSPEELDLEDLERARERLERLQAMTERIANAGREMQQRRGSQNQNRQGSGENASESSSGERGSASSGSAVQASGTGSGSGGSAGEATEMDGDLAELIEELEEALEEYDQALAECEGGGGEEAARLALQRGDEAGERLARLRRRLDDLDTMRQAQQRLAGLCEALGQCQVAVASPNAGGLEAGWGAADSFTNTQETREDGQLTRLRGQQGEGPALTTVEDADSGTGVSTRGTASVNVEFERQLESFVQREDVPRAVRDGVKHYFENIHDGVDE